MSRLVLGPLDAHLVEPALRFLEISAGLLDQLVGELLVALDPLPQPVIDRAVRRLLVGIGLAGILLVASFVRVSHSWGVPGAGGSYAVAWRGGLTGGRTG